MSTNIPEQPAAPDYAAANREGIYTDIETLPQRRLVEAGARTGQIVANGRLFTPEQFQQQLEFEQAKLKEATAAGDQTRINEAKAALDGLSASSDFSQAGDIVYARQAADLASETNARLQREQLALRKELGLENAKQTVEEVKAADPLAYQTRQTTTQEILNALNSPDETVAPNARLMELAASAPEADGRLGALYEAAMSDPGAKATLERLGLGSAAAGAATDRKMGSIYDEATRLKTNFTDASTTALDPVLKQALDDYALGGKLNDAELRSTTNNVRAGQMNRGNFLGDAAAVQEAVAQNAASDAKAQQRLENLMAVQGQVFGQNDALRNESTAAAENRLGIMSGVAGQQAQLGQSLRGEQAGYATTASNEAMAKRAQAAQLAGQDTAQKQSAYQQQLAAAAAAAAEEKSARNEAYAREQQKLANASAIVLGQPVTNQFGSLAGAQQGAVGFTPINYTGGTGLNQNAGNQAAQFAQGNYGTQANMWTTAANIAQQDNAGLMSLASGVGGAALGAMI